ncbi:MFS transporter [Sphingosinicella microcystinivorans]|uniref:MFS transporter n=1 Tax=Sphingosinicella microcystinivorans TaxID=335406 RepID=A0AAD1D852_SPHMI|nr:MFS transporter [Sphingosinicella microcystinivorans]
MLILLTVNLGFAFLDRVALGMLLQDIKVDLDLSDTQLGVLSGIAFALFYAVMGIPLARWADTGNRVTLLTLTTGLWSLAVGLCGVASSFVQLIFIRVGVAVGEAGAFPVGISMIADYFNRAERPRAMAIYTLGGPLALVGGYLLAGVLNELVGWRTTFMLMGAPGLLIAALAWLTLKEPRASESPAARGASLNADQRSGADVLPTVPQEQIPSLRMVLKVLASNRTFRWLLLYISIAFFFVYGNLQWLPSYFMRSWSFSSGEVGLWFALIFGAVGLFATWLGGELATRFAPCNERLQLLTVSFVMIACGLLSTLVFASSHIPVVLVALTGVSLAINVSSGPIYAIIQSLVPERMRAVSMALVMLFANLVGMGLGPLATGALSDLYGEWAGAESLRYALLTMSPGYIVAAWFAWRASRTVAEDLTAVDDKPVLSAESQIPKASAV